MMNEQIFLNGKENTKLEHNLQILPWVEGATACEHCYFSGSGKVTCLSVACTAEVRDDGKDVYFVREDDRKTPGVIYSINIRDYDISIFVDSPAFINVSNEEEAAKLENEIHDALEEIMAKYIVQK